MTQPSDDEPVPKLPRGRGIKLSSPEVFRIVLTAALLVAIIVLTHPCASAVSSFVTSFDNGSAGRAAKAMPKPDNVRPPEPDNVRPPEPDDTTYVRLSPGMTDEQVKAAIDEARAKAKAAAAARGSAAAAVQDDGSAGAAGSAGGGGGDAAAHRAGGSGSAPSASVR